MRKIFDLMFSLPGRCTATILATFFLCWRFDVDGWYIAMPIFFAFMGFCAGVVYSFIAQTYFLRIGNFLTLAIGVGILITLTVLSIKVLVIASDVHVPPLPHPNRAIADWSSMLFAVWYNVLTCIYFVLSEKIIAPASNDPRIGEGTKRLK